MSIKTAALRCGTPVSEHEDEHGEARTILFGIDGRWLEREACADCRLRFAAALLPFVRHARKAGRYRPPGTRSAEDRRHAHAIRQWALGRGLVTSNRGRLPAGAVAQYEAEHPAGQS